MGGRSRILLIGTLSVLSTVLAGVSIAWACTNGAFGTPATPPAAGPTQTPIGGTVAPTVPAPPPSPSAAAAGSSAAAAAPAPAPVVSSTSGAVHSNASATAPASRRTATSSPTRAATPTTGQSQLVAREHGLTAGVTRQGSQTVFTSSTAAGVQTAVTARPRARATARAHAPVTHAKAPSPASAVGDLESGFANSSTATSLASASAAGSGSGSGLSSSVIAGLAILGLGLVALTGGAVVATRPRRARSGNRTKR